MMPFGSTTHAFNTTARRVALPFSVQPDGSLSVTLPVNSAVVPPGDWMLFAIGNNGAPSIASTVQVEPYLSLSDTLGTDTGLTPTITSTIVSQGITKDNTLALSGTLSAAKGFGAVQVYDGATLLGLATVSSGNWSYTTPALLDGSHSFTAKATDNTGKSTTTFAVTATLDTTPPTETISTTIVTDTGATATISGGGVTKDNTLGLSGTVSDANGFSSVQIYDGATLLGPALLNGGYTASYAFSKFLRRHDGRRNGPRHHWQSRERRDLHDGREIRQCGGAGWRQRLCGSRRSRRAAADRQHDGQRVDQCCRVS